MDPPESHNFGLEELFPTSRGGAYDWLWNALSVLRLCGFPTKIDLRWPSLFWILLSFLLHSALMAVPTDPLIVSRIIGDVVDMFVPRVSMNVYYGPKHVTNGCNIKPSITKNSPIVAINGYSHELYTLIMTDPDAPSPSEPSLREWVHWIVTDIPGDSNPIQGNEILPYVTLEPRLGIHRFVLLLFEQKGPLGMVEQPLSRSNFSTRAFAHQLDLGMPVATVYFNAQKEHPLNRKR